MEHLDRLERELDEITGEIGGDAELPEGGLRDMTTHFQNHQAHWEGTRNYLVTKDADYSKLVEVQRSMGTCADLTA